MKSGFGNSKGFTLIEIMTVLALTIIIMGLVFGPLVHAFNLTHHAEVMVRAQDNARLALSQVSRDLSNAMYVYDNTQEPINFPVVDQNDNPVVVPVIYAKVDLVLPRMRAYCLAANHPAGVSREYSRHYVDPGTGLENPLLDQAAPTCPEDGSRLELRPVEPLAPDTKIVRYFIGLDDPTKPFSDPYLSRLTAAGQDNMFLLFRVEFSPFDGRLFKDTSSANIGKNLADPNFYYNNTDNGQGESYAQAWRKISRPVVTIEETDLVRVRYEGGQTIVQPTVRFAPTAVYNDPLVPTSEANDDPENGDTPPTMYKATYGQWVLPYQVIVEPDPNGPYYYEARQGLAQGGTDPASEMCIYRVSRSQAGQPHTFAFNITHYMDTSQRSPYGAGEILAPNDKLGQRAFTVDTVLGTVNCSFPVVPATLSGSLNSAVSKLADSDTINSSGGDAYPYRNLLINEPADQILQGCTIVPGSVKVTAPDASPDNSTGSPAFYTRVPLLLYDPGRNQFAVDPYHDETNGTAEIRFSAQQTPGRNMGEPLPPGTKNVSVFYDVQNNKKGDSFRASYITKSLMSVTMGIRIYDSTTGRAEVVELTNKIRLKNIRS